MKMKYIIVKSGGLEFPIVFSKMLKHSDVGTGLNVVSAGFCELDDIEFLSAYGRSVSLGIESREKDLALIQTKHRW